MIFQYSLDKVLSGGKTETRRIARPGSPPRWRIGASYGVQPGRTQKAVARIEITGVRLEPLGKITARGARAEGHPSVAAFKRAWVEIHGSFDPLVDVWVVRFRLERKDSRATR